jgi:hypothetical protein
MLVEGRFINNFPLREAVFFFFDNKEMGYILGEVYEEPVVIVKCAWQQGTLEADFRPPSIDNNLQPGPAFERILSNVERTIHDMDQILQGHALSSYRGAPSEVVGMAWLQGYSDMLKNGTALANYKANLKAFLVDIRKNLNNSALPIVIGELGGQGSVSVSLDEQNIRAWQTEVVDEDETNMTKLVQTHTLVDQSGVYDLSEYAIYYRQPSAMIEIGGALANSLISVTVIMNADDDAKMRPYTTSEGVADYTLVIGKKQHTVYFVLLLLLGMGSVGFAIARFTTGSQYTWSSLREKISATRAWAIIPTTGDHVGGRIPDVSAYSDGQVEMT